MRASGVSSPSSSASSSASAASARQEGYVDGEDGSVDAAERLIRRYRLTDNDATRAALTEDIEAHGLPAVEDALSRAALADTRGGVSVKFYRAVLAGRGRDAPRGGFTRIPTAEEYAAGASKDGFGWG